MRDWRPLGAVDPAVFLDTRTQLHYAVQVVSAAARALLAPREDFSHTSLSWSEAIGGLSTDALPGGLRVGLVFAEQRVLISGPDGEPDGDDASFALADRPLAEAYAWLSEALTARLGRPVAAEPPTDYALPEHPLGEGAAWSGDNEAAAALGKVYANMDLILAPYAARADASATRCWPHHFDIAVLITLEKGADAESSRTVGLGFTPGDSGIAFPYIYVTPWPYPEERATPALPEGAAWNTEGWYGAVLSSITFARGSGAEQRASAEGFLAAAVALLG